MSLPKTKSEALRRRAHNLIPMLSVVAIDASNDARDADQVLIEAARDLLEAFVGELPNEEAPSGPPLAKRETTAKPASSTNEAAASGHRHKFDDAGRCTVKRDGQPCPDVRKRRRGDAVPPAAPVVSGDTGTLPFKPTMTRHVRTVGGPNAGNVPECGAAMGPLDVFTGDHSAVNCIDCGRALDARRGASL
jgi:hypothetical protein